MSFSVTMYFVKWFSIFCFKFRVIWFLYLNTIWFSLYWFSHLNLGCDCTFKKSIHMQFIFVTMLTKFSCLFVWKPPPQQMSNITDLWARHCTKVIDLSLIEIPVLVGRPHLNSLQKDMCWKPSWLMENFTQGLVINRLVST